MARYKIILTYDGTAFSGMQRQSNARTVQGEVEKALEQIGWKETSIQFAGRTDSGVHASGQVIAFDLEWDHQISKLLNALNANLPKDAAASKAEEVESEFHPRFDAIRRSYQYRIIFMPQRSPLDERYAWRIYPAPDIEKMRTASKALLGNHDFANFGTPPKEGGPTHREVISVNWQTEPDGLIFEITANAFLFHMVRRIVDQLVRIGQGTQDPEIMKDNVENPSNDLVQGLAPPQGLSLIEVKYPSKE